MVFTHSKSAKLSFSFDGQVLKPLKDIKWLVIWFDDKLAFGKQHTQVWFTAANKKKVTQNLDVIKHSAAWFALGVLKSTPVKANSLGQAFPQPGTRNLNAKNLATAASKCLEEINSIPADHPPWRPSRPIKLVINRVAKPEAKGAVIDFISSINLAEELLIYTELLAHPEEGLGAAAVTADGKSSNLCFLGPPRLTSNFECELVGIRLGLEIGLATLRTRSLSRIILMMESQATIERLRNPDAPKPGQYLLSQIRSLAETIDLATVIMISWCPGHSGIQGNKLAKAKAAEVRDPTLLDPTICVSLTAEKN
ncbi:hypothetical protein PCANC_02362 [Puccinia coronata f. sp. avenae]|uniref:Uncharacterized protein n=1 Tax=Puccinia coronata f. sp. avenae TaxID=200324 RepID=A0A2N5VZH5_9BASI|nr:hypothetical protein PCANC_02362 [Puccinia coronata f. sp. avenae]